MTNYTITVRGISNLGPGLYTQNNILVSTGLADRTPIVNLKPKELKALEPSMQEMEFICEAVGIPKPEISWTWNSVPIEDGVDRFRLFDISDVNSKEETQSKLVFEASTRSGVISCHAENRDGADEQNVEIEILGPGSPPKHIRPKTLENGFHVEWEAPKYPNGEIT
uniref:Ig-like domain-containing protein n=1 Tax=Acrobeloides nanus TaxID=290746 RepID=A0A914D5V0_9BILA